jgi:hypothetical protein
MGILTQQDPPPFGQMGDQPQQQPRQMGRRYASPFARDVLVVRSSLLGGAQEARQFIVSSAGKRLIKGAFGQNAWAAVIPGHPLFAAQGRIMQANMFPPGGIPHPGNPGPFPPPRDNGDDGSCGGNACKPCCPPNVGSTPAQRAPLVLRPYGTACLSVRAQTWGEHIVTTRELLGGTLAITFGFQQLLPIFADSVINAAGTITATLTNPTDVVSHGIDISIRLPEGLSTIPNTVLTVNTMSCLVPGGTVPASNSNLALPLSLGATQSALTVYPFLVEALTSTRVMPLLIGAGDPCQVTLTGMPAGTQLSISTVVVNGPGWHDRFLEAA